MLSIYIPYESHVYFAEIQQFTGQLVVESELVNHCLQVITVNSRFLERPQKRSCGNQLIHSRLTKTKSIDSGEDPESQAGRQSDGYDEWCLELRRGGRHGRMGGRYVH